MRIEDAINKIIDQCEIYYGDVCISNEPVVKDYLRFFSKTFNPSEKRVSFSLNTGSVVFDIVASVAAVISSLGYNENSNEDIISNLQIGDMVLYKNKRYIWDGLKEENGNVYMVLKKNEKDCTMTLYEKNKHLVKEYHGTSKTTDGRGIRKRKTNREDFFSFIYDTKVENIPSAIDASFVIVAEKSFGIEYLKEICIKYKNKQVHLLDLIACSYYTSGMEEIVIGNNPSKKEPVLKLTSKISTARELALSREGNNIAGVIVNVTSNTLNDNSELKDLIGRKRIRFVHYMTRYDTAFGEVIAKEYTTASMFACTPKYLKEIDCSTDYDDGVMNDLIKQMNNLSNLDLEEVHVKSNYSFEMIKMIKKGIFTVKDSDIDEEDKNDFILNSFSLLNLYLTSPFNLYDMEKCIEENKLRNGVISPKTRLINLEENLSKFGPVKSYAEPIVEFLKNEYDTLYGNNPKEKALETIIRNNIKRNIAIVVPKAYYRDVLKNTSVFGINLSNVTIETSKAFDPDSFYDVIIVVGDIDNNKFKVFECCSASKIFVLLYESENKCFKLKKNKAKAYEGNIYNKHKKYSYRIDERKENEEIMNTENIEDIEDIEDISSGFDDLDNYIDNLRYTIPSRYTTNPEGESGSSVSEVSHIGYFETGERIFMSKYYSAVVYYENKGVEEKNVEKLQAGDVIVFTKNDNYTMNIVDCLFEELLDQNKLSENVKGAFDKSERWKKLLRDYKDCNNYSYRDVTEKLNELGLDYGEVAIRQWIIPESHIVGPRKDEVIEIIGKLVNDEDMIVNYKKYDEAFKLVRTQRRKIRGLISRAINEKLSGKYVSGDEIIQIVFDNVDKLSETYELESIQKLEEPLYMPVGIVNRPVDSEDIGL